MRNTAEAVTERLVKFYRNNGNPFPPAAYFAAVERACSDISYHPVTEAALFEAFADVADFLPKSYLVSFQQLCDHANAGVEHVRSAPTVPLYDALTDCGRAIYKFFLRVMYDPDIKGLDLLPDIRKTLWDNERQMNHLSAYERRRTEVPEAYERDEPSDKLCWLYFKDTPFLELFYTPIPFSIPRKTWSSHGIALAPSGFGKTQLIGALIAQFLKEENPPGMFILDPHGDLYNNLIARIDPRRIVALDPDTSPPPLNFLDFGTSTEAQTLQTFSYLMSSLSGGMSDKQGAIVPYLLKLLRAIEQPSLETLRQIVDEKVKSLDKSQFYNAILKLQPVDQGFFQHQFYSSRMQETKDAIGWKLYAALSSDAFRQMFAPNAKDTLHGVSREPHQPQSYGVDPSISRIDFDALIADRKVVIVKGGFDSLGEEGMRVFLQFLVAQYYAAGMRRLRLPEKQRHLNLFICDEASHILTTPIVARMLFDLRKVACGFLGATQVWEQVATEVKAAVLGNTAIKIVGPVQHNDASVLSREMYCDIDFIRGMQRSDDSPYANWAVYVGGMTKKAAKVRVPFGVLEKMPKYAPQPPAYANTVASFLAAKARGQTHEAPEADELREENEEDFNAWLKETYPKVHEAETHEAPQSEASQPVHGSLNPNTAPAVIPDDPPTHGDGRP